MTALLVLLVAFSLVGLVSFFAERQERRRAAERLVLARMAFECGDLERTLRLLDQAFFVPALSRYAARDAKVALEATRLLSKILEQQAGAVCALAPLRDALERASAHGGEVSDALTQPVKRYLQSGWVPPASSPYAHGHA